MHSGRTHSPDPGNGQGQGGGPEEVTVFKFEPAPSPERWFIRNDHRGSLEALDRICIEAASKALAREENVVTGGATTQKVPTAVWASIRLLTEYLRGVDAATKEEGLNKSLQVSLAGVRENAIEKRILTLFRDFEREMGSAQVELIAKVQGEIAADVAKASNPEKASKYLSKQIAGQLADVREVMQRSVAGILKASSFCRLAMSPPPGNPAVVDSIWNQDVSGEGILGAAISRVFQNAPAAQAHRERLVLLAKIEEALLKNMVARGQDLRLLVVGGGGVGIDIAELISNLKGTRDVDLLGNLKVALMDRSSDGNPDGTSIGNDTAAARITQAGHRLNAFSRPQVTTEPWQADAMINTYRHPTWPDPGFPDADVVVVPGTDDYIPSAFLPAFERACLHSAPVRISSVITPADPDKFTRSCALGWMTIERDAARVVSDMAATAKFLGEVPPGVISFKGNLRQDITNSDQLLDAIYGKNGAKRIEGGDCVVIPVDAAGVNLLKLEFRDDFSLVSATA